MFTYYEAIVAHRNSLCNISVFAEQPMQFIVRRAIS